MSSSKSNPLELAKQGDPNAIAALLNRTLQPKGITASAEQEDGFLQIILKAAQVPNQQAVVTFIHQGMTKLESEAIHTVRIDGYQNGQDTPAWSDEFGLETAALFHSDVMPPIEETQSYEDEDLHSPGIDDEYPESAGIDDINGYEVEEDGEEAEEAPPAKGKRPINKGLLLGGIGALAALAAVAAIVVLKPPIPGLPSGNDAEEASAPADPQTAPAKPAAPAAPAATGNKPATPVPAATANKPVTPVPAATPNKPTTPTPAPAAQSDPWREGVNNATKAANLAQTASTQAEWDAVAAQWQQAIELMKKVPQSSPNYQAAQDRVVSYQSNLNYAQQNAANSY
ncbi:hypothetical protein [Microcoleus sp. FACHB-672]|uniref:hypothetical protein n=1 Tax=Microcoleus sp. FACHB-672 TaxID=2692825 RepID=UPI0016828E15|nr:hypothetical protein [Microcoleus sp. FACHB-672]MBD2040896.1 hypothetical protein [Microcoleus sp. FACHB-672]